MGKFADILESIEDTPTAKTAVAKFDGIATEFESLVDKMREKGLPTGATKGDVEEIFKKAEAGLQRRVSDAMRGLGDDEEVKAILTNAMAAFGTRMEKHDDIIEAWSGRDNSQPRPPNFDN